MSYTAKYCTQNKIAIQCESAEVAHIVLTLLLQEGATFGGRTCVDIENITNSFKDGYDILGAYCSNGYKFDNSICHSKSSSKECWYKKNNYEFITGKDFLYFNIEPIINNNYSLV